MWCVLVDTFLAALVTARPAPLVVEAEGELVAGEVAERGGTAAVEGVGRAEGGQPGGAGGDGFGEAEGVGDLEVGLEVDGPVVGDLVGGERDVPFVRGGSDVGLASCLGHEPGAGVVDEPFSWEGVRRLAHHAVCSSTNAAASAGEGDGGLRDRPARHGVTDPVRTPAHSCGRR